MNSAELKQKFEEENGGQRFHLNPQYRIPLITMTAGVFGAGTGFFKAAKGASLKYLAENAHRLPKSMAGWYFYHKKKNYVVLQAGMIQSFKNGSKVGFIVGSCFGLEAALDHVRGCIDFGNSIMATVTAGVAYSIYSGLNKHQTLNTVKRGLGLGLAIGLAQDALIYSRGGNLWYLDAIGIPPITRADVTINESAEL